MLKEREHSALWMFLQKPRLEVAFTAGGSVGGECLRLRSDPDLSHLGGASLSAKLLSAISPIRATD